MHMKEDYYGGSNIFKAGYNVQVGVSDEYIMEVSVVQDRCICQLKNGPVIN